MVECPVCNVELLEINADQLEEHVNGCLDKSILEEKRQMQHAKRVTSSMQFISKQETNMEDNMAVGGAKAMLEEIEQSEFHMAGVPKYDVPATEQYALQTSYGSKHPLPSYKKMPFTTFTVDAFKYGKLDFCTGYFLTHFHSDHYGGLSKGFTGHIYCSRITANCVQNKIGVDPCLIHALPMNRRCNVQGVFVTFIDANHCPGAVIIVFEIPQANGRMVRIVHTGDFRASHDHVKQIMHILAVKHTETQSKAGKEQQKKPTLQLTNWFKVTSKAAPARTSKRRVLFVVGSYTIGKERLFIEIAQRLRARIYVTAAKRRMLECLGSHSLLQMLTDSMSAQVHVVEMSRVNMRGLTEHLAMAQKHAPFSSIVAFRPTGWSHAPGALYQQQPRGPDPPDPAVLQRLVQNYKDPAQLAQRLAQALLLQSDSQFTINCLQPRGASASVTIFPVPYSEHSSFAELGRFVCSFKTEHVVPTVSCDAANARWLQHWQNANALFAQAATSLVSPDLHTTLGLSL
ncbi:repair protein PSO2 SNM1 [Coemansia brasiliensis]|uniref:Repair protein PSO2 SNM1 n=1 Tax=Coemansia brasiliensis TaxID=2650707 RepID=A0A9W8IC37_9FUNG|nr:repair protein PSO2 SNM1 [Coemansia brasiliensis]